MKWIALGLIGSLSLQACASRYRVREEVTGTEKAELSMKARAGPEAEEVSYSYSITSDKAGLYGEGSVRPKDPATLIVLEPGHYVVKVHENEDTLADIEIEAKKGVRTSILVFPYNPLAFTWYRMLGILVFGFVIMAVASIIADP